MVIPGLALVKDNSSPEAPSRVDASTSNWDCGEVNHEHSKSNGERCQYLDSKEEKGTKKKNIPNEVFSCPFMKTSMAT
jgi:hypothetical protein